MTPDFDKIQAGHLNSVRKTERKQKEQNIKKQEEVSSPSYDEVQADTGVIGRSAVKVDNFDADIKKFMENPTAAKAKMSLVDILLEKGYSLEEAVYAIHTEFDS